MYWLTVPTRSAATAYRIAVAIAVGTTLFLVLGMGALGIIGSDGDRADLMFFGVIAIEVVGAVAARFRAAQMAIALLATAAATMTVGVIALILGKHNAPHSSVLEILGLTGMYAALFASSAWQFRRAATPTH